MASDARPGVAHTLSLSGGRFSTTSRADLDGLIARFAAGPADAPLVLHFHGGLNTLEDGLARAGRMAPVYRAAGAFPIFVCWRSGVTEVLGNAFGRIMNERVYQRLVALLAGFLVGKAQGTGAVRGAGAQTSEGAGDGAADRFARTVAQVLDGADPAIEADPVARRRLFRLQEAELRRLRNELMNDAVIQEDLSAIARGLGEAQSADPVRGAGGSGLAGGIGRSSLFRPEVLERMRGSKGDVRGSAFVFTQLFGDIVTRICARLSSGRDHGLTATVVEEILQKLYLVETWFGWMKSEITSAFEAEADRGGTALLSALDARWRAGQRPRILLVGHSAGSIYICNLIEQAQKLMPQARFEVVFLTPACSFRRFARTLEGNDQAIASIRNISLADNLEREDGYPGYPRSLLYFTSGVMEYDEEDLGDVPIVGMQRYYRAATPYDQASLAPVREYFAARPGSLIWVDGSPATAAVSTARGHGDFDVDPGTEQTLARYVREGFAAVAH